MRLRFAIEFGVGRGNGFSKGGSMSDWADEKARSEKARLAAEQQKIAGWIENRKLIEEQGPALWKELRTRIEASVEDLNRSFGKGSFVIVGDDPSEMDIRFTVRDPALQLLVWFEASTSQRALRWSYPGGRGKDRSYRLVADSSGVLCFWSSGYSSAPEAIAKSMFDGLLQEQ